MQNRTFAYVNDSNNGQYNGSNQITIDCSGIANSGKYMSFQQSFSQIPLVMILSALVGQLNNVTCENNFAACLKNSYTTLIHSLGEWFFVVCFQRVDLFPMETQKSMEKKSTVKFHGFTERTLRTALSGMLANLYNIISKMIILITLSWLI